MTDSTEKLLERMRERRKILADRLKSYDDEKEDKVLVIKSSNVSNPLKEQEQEPIEADENDDNNSMAVKSRKGRLATLSADISNWEDESLRTQAAAAAAAAASTYGTNNRQRNDSSKENHPGTHRNTVSANQKSPATSAVSNAHRFISPPKPSNAGSMNGTASTAKTSSGIKSSNSTSASAKSQVDKYGYEKSLSARNGVEIKESKSSGVNTLAKKIEQLSVTDPANSQVKSSTFTARPMATQWRHVEPPNAAKVNDKSEESRVQNYVNNSGSSKQTESNNKRPNSVVSVGQSDRALDTLEEHGDDVFDDDDERCSELEIKDITSSEALCNANIVKETNENGLSRNDGRIRSASSSNVLGNGIKRTVENKTNGTVVTTLHVQLTGGVDSNKATSSGQTLGSKLFNKPAYPVQANVSRPGKLRRSVSDVGKQRQIGKIGQVIEEDVAEPTKQTVAERRAVWQNRMHSADDATCESSGVKIITARDQGIPGNAKNGSQLNGKPTNVTKQLSNASVCVKKREVINTNTSKPSVLSFASNVKSNISALKNVIGKAVPARKDSMMNKSLSAGSLSAIGRSGSQAGSRMSPGRRVAPATSAVQQRLAEMCEVWKSNEISSKSKSDRSAELQQLEDRWKHPESYDLVGGEADTQETGRHSSISGPPPAPPLPPQGWSNKIAVGVTKANNFKSEGATSNINRINKASVNGNSPTTSNMNRVVSNASTNGSTPTNKSTDNSNNNSNKKNKMASEMLAASRGMHGGVTFVPSPYRADPEDTETADESVCDSVADRIVDDFGSNLVDMGFNISPDGDTAVVNLGKEIQQTNKPQLRKSPAATSLVSRVTSGVKTNSVNNFAEKHGVKMINTSIRGGSVTKTSANNRSANQPMRGGVTNATFTKSDQKISEGMASGIERRGSGVKNTTDVGGKVGQSGMSTKTTNLYSIVKKNSQIRASAAQGPSAGSPSGAAANKSPDSSKTLTTENTALNRNKVATSRKVLPDFSTDDSFLSDVSTPGRSGKTPSKKKPVVRQAKGSYRQAVGGAVGGAGGKVTRNLMNSRNSSDTSTTEDKGSARTPTTIKRSADRSVGRNAQSISDKRKNEREYVARSAQSSSDKRKNEVKENLSSKTVRQYTRDEEFDAYDMIPSDITEDFASEKNTRYGQLNRRRSRSACDLDTIARFPAPSRGLDDNVARFPAPSRGLDDSVSFPSDTEDEAVHQTTRYKKKSVQFSSDTATGSDTDDCSGRVRARGWRTGAGASGGGGGSNFYMDMTSATKHIPLTTAIPFSHRQLNRHVTSYLPPALSNPTQQLRPASDVPHFSAGRTAAEDLIARQHVGAFLANTGAPQPPPLRQRRLMEDWGVQQPAAVSNRSMRLRLHGLQEMVREQELVQAQAGKALTLCSKDIGSYEYIECHRLLLLANCRRTAYLEEITRLQGEGRGERLGGGEGVEGLTGRLTISDVRLPLKPEFIAKIGTVHDTSYHSFVVVVRCLGGGGDGCNVAASHVMCTRGSMTLGSLSLPHQICLNRVPQHFSLLIDLYAIILSRDEVDSETPRKKSRQPTTQRELLTPRSNKSERRVTSLSEFVHLASLELNELSLSKVHFTMSRVPYTCPLQGTIHMKMKHVADSCVRLKGFLSIYDGPGAGRVLKDDDMTRGEESRKRLWSRRWCILDNDQIHMWRYISEEMYKQPLGRIDLRACINEIIEPVQLASDTRPRALSIFTVPPLIGRIHSAQSPLIGRYNQGVAKRRNDLSDVLETWLLADTTRECMEWCDNINEVMKALRAWHPFSAPSVRSDYIRNQN